MNTNAVNHAAGVIRAAIEQGRTPAGIALALDASGLLQSPETAARVAKDHTELLALRRRVAEMEQELPEGGVPRQHIDHRVVAERARAAAGGWVYVASYPYPSARQIASRIRMGALANYAPRGAFEARAPKGKDDGGEARLYVRTAAKAGDA